MESAPVSPVKGHRRNRSAVLKNVLKRGASEDKQTTASMPAGPMAMNMPFLPPDHPHSGQRVLSEIPPNNNTAQPRRPTATSEKPKMLHKRTKSAISLRSLGIGKEEKSTEKTDSRPNSRRREKDGESSPTKSKSGASITAMFKSKSRDDEHESGHSDKENSSPPNKPSPHTPIYAAYATQLETSSTTKVPLNDRDKRQSIIEQIALYDPDPKRCNESKQRNFYGHMPGSGGAVRPKSEVISGHALGRFLDGSTSRKSSEERRRDSQENSSDRSKPPAPKHTQSESAVATAVPIMPRQRPRLEDRGNGSRVKDAVARIDRRSKIVVNDAPVDPKKFDTDFDAMLEARNIPGLVRQQMRELEHHVKQALLTSYEQDVEAGRTQSAESDVATGANSASSSRPTTQGNAADTTSSKVSTSSKEEKKPEKTETKKSRPRSLTFTFKKSDKDKNGTTSTSASPTKKQRTGTSIDMKHASQPDLTSPSLMSTSPATPSGSYFRGFSKKSVPEDYVKHLQKHREPADLEVGKLHKLRQLLRNETLPWVHKFIELGGMAEIVGLLHRLMDIEWREERDDQLLNEALLCLKGLCTTDLAMQKLCEVEKELFPALIAMLFDKEHRGPSEFTTRQIVFNILLTHLEAAVNIPDVLPIRARTILGYLSDQENADKRNPLPFDFEVGPKRPYKVWNREVSNVTKEVFWVWLHQLNIIPYPQLDVQMASTDCMPPGQHPPIKKRPSARDVNAETYTREFFPRPRPPVPAAPYIGGVEWDATNYLAVHIDLLNGLVASLPTREERNNLRAELRASGFEKTMGERLRQCKEKYYGAVHDVLRTWVAAGCADGWEVKDVRMGPPKEESPRKSPRKSPVKKKTGDKPPVLEAPPKLMLDLGGLDKKDEVKDGNDGKVDNWL